MSNTVEICDELKQNFIDFSYEANSERAFADARDGLKPGQRACLWEMYNKGYVSSKSHVKSAKISGGVVASWWPHSNDAIYDTFVRMSQSWINNIPEVDWHGNNGNIVIGNCPAAARYTEARLAKVVEEGMFCGIKKNNVPMKLNFSEDDEWPEVLPAIFPRLLVNGCQGIGVTIANVWLPMNLTEVIETILEYAETGHINTNKYLIDFPSGGTIINKDDLHLIHETGKGKVIVRAKTEISGNSILITELPYQVFIEPLIEDIKKLVANDEIGGIENIMNKTDKDKILIEIVCDGNPKAVLNKLYSMTDLQKVFNANQFALVSKTPKLLTLKDYIDIYLKHNESCITKEYQYDLNKAQARLEVVNGLLKAIVSIDEIIQLIKKSDSSKDAVEKLKTIYDFTDAQAKAIVGMKLGSLARLESVELNREKAELTEQVSNCLQTLNTPGKILEKVLDRLKAFGKKYQSTRKTQLTQVEIIKDDEIKNVEPEKCVVIMTEAGNIKRIPATAFKTQRRNTKGVKTQDDITSAIIRTNTVDNLMVFTDKGKMYRLLVDSIPEGTNTSKGTSIRSLINLEPSENPTVIYSMYRDNSAKYVLFVTKNGIVKKTDIAEYNSTKRKNGIGAITLKENDELAAVTLINNEELFLVTHNGYVLRFNSSEIVATSRMTMGVKGITLGTDDFVVAALPIRTQTDNLALFSTIGHGKQIILSEIPILKRGSKGLQGVKNESIAAAQLVNKDDNVLLIGASNSICISAQEIPVLSRAATGNTMLKTIISASKV